MPRINWMTILLAVTIILNLFDAVSTLLAVQLGSATEANPLMAHLLQRSAVLFMFAKLSLVSCGVALLYRWRHLRLARMGTVVATVAYAAVIAIHVNGWHGLT